MAFTQSENTLIRRVQVPKLADYKIEVLANSYKDGSVELTLVDDYNDINIDYIVDTTINTISNVVITITKLILSTGLKVTSRLEAAIRRSVIAIVQLAKPFKGRPTRDYNLYCCQAKLVIGN